MTIDYLILVNKENKIPANWEKNVELVGCVNAWGEQMLIEKEALIQFRRLKKDLYDKGINIYLDSTYRSVADQMKTWEIFEKEFGIEYTKTHVAIPGFSEHHTGLAIDICLIVDGKIIYDNDVLVHSVDLFKIIHESLWKYGFILRYPKGKKTITGYDYEPWHFRYVSSVDIAKYIQDNNITLEEYLERRRKKDENSR